MITHPLYKTLAPFLAEIPSTDNRCKIPPRSFVISLICSMAERSVLGSLSSLQMAVASILGICISKGAFVERLTRKRTLNYLRRLLFLMFKIDYDCTCSVMKELRAKLMVKSIFCLDSTTVTLDKDLGAEFPNNRTNNSPAAFKLHKLFNFLTMSFDWVKVTAAAPHDSNFVPFRLFKSALVIIDLGYYCFEIFDKIAKKGGYYLSRLRADANGDIHSAKAATEEYSKALTKLVKKKFSKLRNKKKYYGQVIELELIFANEYSPRRVIGFWHQESSRYRYYVTNLSCEAELIWPLYRLRWQVELSFKADKSTLQLDKITVKNKTALESLIYATCCAALLARLAAEQAKTHLTDKQAQYITLQRIAKAFKVIAQKLAEALVSPEQCKLDALDQAIKISAPMLFDPNYKKRKNSLTNVVTKMPLAQAA